MGRQISEYWSGGSFVPRAVQEGWRPSYIHLNAAFDFMFGESRLALVVLNMFAGVWTALLTFYLTREFLTREVCQGRGAAHRLLSVARALVDSQHP